MGVSIGVNVGPVRVSHRLGRHRRGRAPSPGGSVVAFLLAAAIVFYVAVACWTAALAILCASLAKPEWRPAARRVAVIPLRTLEHLT